MSCYLALVGAEACKGEHWEAYRVAGIQRCTKCRAKRAKPEGKPKKKKKKGNGDGNDADQG